MVHAAAQHRGERRRVGVAAVKRLGGGFLQKRNDAYVMEAELKKGLLTINGAPMPVPLGGM